jgi:hypothetical protein
MLQTIEMFPFPIRDSLKRMLSSRMLTESTLEIYFLPSYTASHPRRKYSSQSPPRGLQISVLRGSVVG